ncbi:unnamed protein product [Adineta ricciae]|uniref:F-box domain-containing protein n=1 Tax=Adineta ricciae TaxID=249248 RepID=A0A815QKA8_ADIRI|nr:unnamed protein product [Adineta ricciae]CAF1464213.1 unnamed protein product [Adineta ricciae]
MSTLSFVDFPVEIIHHIFDYCDILTIFLSIRSVCKRFYKLVETYNQLNLVLNSKTHYYIKFLSRCISPACVVSLHFKNDNEKWNLFSLFQSLFSLDQFTQLRSLTLFYIKNEDLEYFFEHLNIQQLISLSIHLNLQRLFLSNIDYPFEQLTWSKSNQLFYLSIDQCSYENYLSILEQLPHLQTFIMKNCHFNYNFKSFPSKLNSSLKSLTISKFSISRQNLPLFFSPIHSLKHLKVISHRQEIDYVFNGSTWENIIEINLPELDQFQFFFSCVHSDDQNFIDLHLMIESFRSSFYLLTKSCFVTSTFLPRRREVWLFTTPMCINNYTCDVRHQISWTNHPYHFTKQSINVTSKTHSIETSSITFDLGGYGIKREGLRCIADVLQNDTTISLLDLYNNGIENEDVQYLVNVLRNNKSLKTLNLSQNSIGDQGVEHLARFLRENQTLTSLNLLHNQISHDGADFLAQALMRNQTLTTLHLWNNRIGNEGAEYFSIMLRQNSTLKLLDLSANQIRDEGAMELLDALQENQTLKELWLWNNSITPQSKSELKQISNRINL